MIAIAILTVIAGIAIPAYNGYIREARINAATANIEPLRIALEDFWLDNGTYGVRNPEVWVPGGANTLSTGTLGLAAGSGRQEYVQLQRHLQRQLLFHFGHPHRTAQRHPDFQ